MRVVPQSTSGRFIAAGAAIAVAVPVTVLAVTATTATTASTAASTTAEAAISPVAATTAVTSAQLISASDIGAGWTEISMEGQAGQAAGLIQGLTVTPASCAKGLSIPKGYQSESHRVFRQGTAQYGPYLANAVAQFSTNKAAKKAIKKAKKKLAKCSSVSVSTSMGSGDATISKLKVAKLGGQTVGYNIDATVMGFVPASGQVVVVRKGNVISIVGQAGPGTVPVALTTAVAAKAAALI